LRGTFPVLVPLAIVVVLFSTAISAWQYCRILRMNRSALQVRSELIASGYQLKQDIDHLETATRLFKNAYAESELNLTLIITNDLQTRALTENRCRFMFDQYVRSELNLSEVYVNRQQFPEAIIHLRRAIEFDPNAVLAMSNLAFLLATAPDAGLRNGEEAVRLAELACQKTQYQEIVPLRTLAAAYAEAGRFADAVAVAQKVCALAGTRGKKQFLAQDEQLLELYQSGRAYHQNAQPAP